MIFSLFLICTVSCLRTKIIVCSPSSSFSFSSNNFPNTRENNNEVRCKEVLAWLTLSRRRAPHDPTYLKSIPTDVYTGVETYSDLIHLSRIWMMYSQDGVAKSADYRSKEVYHFADAESGTVAENQIRFA